jgi:hypothetical protein
LHRYSLSVNRYRVFGDPIRFGGYPNVAHRHRGRRVLRSAPMPFRLTAIVLAMGVSMVALTFTQSRSSAPPQSKQGPRPLQSSPSAAPDQRGTEASPAVVKVLPTPKSQGEIAQEERDRQSDLTNRRWTIGLAALTALAAIGQIWVIKRQTLIAREQNEIMRSQSEIMKLQEKAASNSAALARTATEISDKQYGILQTQATHMAEGLELTRGALEASRDNALSAAASAQLSADNLKALQTIERAYVTMSHDPPGLRIGRFFTSDNCDPEPYQDVGFAIQVKNYGTTPAEITYVLIQWVDHNGPLPDVPLYDSAKWGQAMRVLLVKDETLRVFKNVRVPVKAIRRARMDRSYITSTASATASLRLCPKVRSKH